jgi:broad specificity polyphosphatase/5'/3'-nucleotidase SurE
MINDKVRDFLALKQSEYEKIIMKYKKKKKIIKGLYISSVLVSITTSVIISSSMLGIPAIAVSILGVTGALSSALSIKFNLKKTNDKIQNTITSLNKIKTKLEYIVNFNGDLSQEEYISIFKEFELY